MHEHGSLASPLLRAKRDLQLLTCVCSVASPLHGSAASHVLLSAYGLVILHVHSCAQCMTQQLQLCLAQQLASALLLRHCQRARHSRHQLAIAVANLHAATAAAAIFATAFTRLRPLATPSPRWALARLQPHLCLLARAELVLAPPLPSPSLSACLRFWLRHRSAKAHLPLRPRLRADSTIAIARLWLASSFGSAALASPPLPATPSSPLGSGLPPPPPLLLSPQLSSLRPCHQL